MDVLRFLKKTRLRVAVALGAIGAALGVSFVFDQPAIFWTLIAFSVGLSVGGMLGFDHGLDAKEEILEEIYGEDWRQELSYGHYVHTKHEEALRN